MTGIALRPARAALLLLVLTPPSLHAQAPPDSLAPALALHRFHEQMAAAGQGANQGDIAGALLKQARKGNLDDAEGFALGELYFVALKPDEADAAFARYRNGTDLRARVALQRHLRMRMAAFQIYGDVEDTIRAARARLSVSQSDPWHLMPAVSTLARYHAGRGEHAVVVRLVMDEIGGLPVDGVYFSHLLPGTFLESFTAEGKRDEAIAHLERVRDALASGERSERNEAPPVSAHREGVFHRLEEGLLSDLPEPQRLRFLRGRLYGALVGMLARASG